MDEATRVLLVRCYQALKDKPYPDELRAKIVEALRNKLGFTDE